MCRLAEKYGNESQYRDYSHEDIAFSRITTKGRIFEAIKNNAERIGFGVIASIAALAAIVLFPLYGITRLIDHVRGVEDPNGKGLSKFPAIVLYVPVYNAERWWTFAKKGKEVVIKEEDLRWQEEGIAAFSPYETFCGYPFTAITEERAIEIRKKLHANVEQVFHPERVRSN